MNERERLRDGLEGGRHGGVIAGGRLELRERAAYVVQRDVRVGRELARSLELVERAHRLRDGRREVHEVTRHARVGLQGVESARERLACRA
ncbi:MAG: hypothetical protein KF782_05900 [Labilithrix sp.]|nr:hypothetical protein [Labilithrix sp.]